MAFRSPCRTRLAAHLWLALSACCAHAGVSSTGEIAPTDPASWTSDTDGAVGVAAAGSLTVAEGGALRSKNARLGVDATAEGAVTVSGPAARWTNESDMSIGLGGVGSLNIASGGRVDTIVASLGATRGARGEAHVSGGGHWEVSSHLEVGYAGTGLLTISDGGTVYNHYGYLAEQPGSEGYAAVSGVGSFWNTTSDLYVGYSGAGRLLVEQGGRVYSLGAYIGLWAGSSGEATVTGGARWHTPQLSVGYEGSGQLEITDGALLSVAGVLTIDRNGGADSFVNLSTGGMLALFGEADDSLTRFLDLVSGTDAIRYWDASLHDWSPLTEAAYGQDYTLEHLTTGELAGYTLLTVGAAVPEPAAALLAGIAFSSAILRRRLRA